MKELGLLAMEEKYLRINFYQNRDFLSSQEVIKDLGFNNYQCYGIQEFDLGEREVDQILGARSYASAHLPTDFYGEIEEYAREQGKVSSYFFNLKDGEHFLSYISQNYPELVVSKETLETEDWNQSWKEHYKPIIISEKLVIAPAWNKDFDGKSSVLIEPGQGFGTGNHETTYLCLDLLAKEVTPIKSCLDYGCGSGILGIAASRINQLDRLYFYDIDEVALENCLHNIEINEPVSAKEIWITSKPSKDQVYDLVFANILQNILHVEKEEISATVAKDGFLVLSGILVEQVKETLELYTAKEFEIIKNVHKGDWAALLLKKRVN